MNSQQQNSDLTTKQQLGELVTLANQTGAQGIFLIRGAKEARLLYQANPKAGPDATPINFDIADTDLLILMRFPAGDGGQPGIESR